MNKLKKTLALVAALGLACTAFVGCGSSSSDDSSSTTTTAASESSSAADTASDTTPAAADETDAEGDTEGGTEAASSAAATDDWKAADSSLKDDGDTLTIVGWTTADLAHMFEAYTGKEDGGAPTDSANGTTPVKFQQVGTSGDEALEQYTTYFDSGKDVDLYCTEAAWILEYITNNKYAVPLSELGFTADSYPDAYQYTLDTATVDGNLMGATWQAAPGGWVYRTDLAEQYLGVKSPEEMQDKVKDWDTFWATAKDVKDKSNGKTTMTATAAGVWQAYSTSMNKTWVDKDMNLDTSGCEDYIKMMKSAVDNGYVNNTEQWTDAWYAEGQDDSTLGYFFSTWCLTDGTQLEQASGGKDGKTYGKWNIVVGPCNYFWGGTWLVASPNCDNATAAHNFIKYFTVDEKNMEAYASKYGDFVNNKTAMAAQTDYKNPALGGQNQFTVLADAADGITLSDTATKYDQTCKVAFNQAVTDNFDNLDTEKVMNDFKTDLASKNSDIKIS